MNIKFNSQNTWLTEAENLLAFLHTQLSDCDAVLARCVVAVNKQLVPSTCYESYRLQDQDEVELLTAMVGG